MYIILNSTNRMATLKKQGKKQRSKTRRMEPWVHERLYKDEFKERVEKYIKAHDLSPQKIVDGLKLYTKWGGREGRAFKYVSPTFYFSGERSPADPTIDYGKYSKKVSVYAQPSKENMKHRIYIGTGEKPDHVPRPLTNSELRELIETGTLDRLKKKH